MRSVRNSDSVNKERRGRCVVVVCAEVVGRGGGGTLAVTHYGVLAVVVVLVVWLAATVVVTLAVPDGMVVEGRWVMLSFLVLL